MNYRSPLKTASIKTYTTIIPIIMKQVGGVEDSRLLLSLGVALSIILLPMHTISWGKISFKVSSISIRVRILNYTPAKTTIGLRRTQRFSLILSRNDFLRRLPSNQYLDPTSLSRPS